MDYIATDGLYVLIMGFVVPLALLALGELAAIATINRLEGRKQKKRPGGVGSTYEAGGGLHEHESTSIVHGR